MSIPITLTIAGSDSSGGAGIQADLKTFAALKTYGCSVITAITAQNTQGVQAIKYVTPNMVVAQCQSIFTDLAVNAIKIGMLGQQHIIHALADYLESLPEQPAIILDPVMISSSGSYLLEDSAISALKERLIPKASLITPNLLEAAALLGVPVPESTDMMQALLEDLRALGSQAVLLKGGHLTSKQSTDLLFDGQEVQAMSAPFIMTNNNHGTGCSLSSAIAASLAQGNSMKNAVVEAKTYVHKGLTHADRLNIGQGHGPIHHFVEWWR